MRYIVSESLFRLEKACCALSLNSGVKVQSRYKRPRMAGWPLCAKKRTFVEYSIFQLKTDQKIRQPSYLIGLFCFLF